MVSKKLGITGRSVGVVIYWIRNHKFWTSVITFSVVLIFLYAFKPFNPFGLGSLLGYVFWAYILGCYIFVGGLVWSGYTGKRGMTMISLGISSAFLALYAWWIILNNWEFEVIGFSMAVISTLLGAFFLYSGIKRYRNSLKNT